ncbi:MAG: glutaredoxin family protein [Myxococcota bacterium]
MAHLHAKASWVCAVLLAVAACKPSSEGAPDGSASAALPPPLTFSATDQNLLFSYVDETGGLRNADRVQDIPDDRRRNVMVVDLAKTPEERMADRYVYFSDVTSPGPDGKYVASVVSRYQAPTLTAPGPAAEPTPTGEGKDVVVYSAVWCGYCKKTKAFLKQRGVPFVERDVEKDPGADRELQAKARKAGVRVSGVPVTDFKGELVMGFDQGRLDTLIKKHAAAGP